MKTKVVEVPAPTDPAAQAAAAATAAETQRAEASRIAATQSNLSADTLTRLRRFGAINRAGGSIPIAALPGLLAGGGSTVGLGAGGGSLAGGGAGAGGGGAGGGFINPFESQGLNLGSILY